MTNISDWVFQEKLQAHHKGSFGTVFEATNFQHQVFVIKCLELKIKEEEIDLKEVCQEYFMALICSVLQVGPQIKSIYGYDIITTRKRAFFAQEKCEFIRVEDFDRIKDSIHKSLLLLHSMGFVHLDIKPENMMFSPTFAKYVLIDFGLSRLIAQKVGEKTLTSFAGSLKYCSEAMRKVYLCGSKGYVDLYHNDAICLLRSLQIVSNPS